MRNLSKQLGCLICWQSKNPRNLQHSQQKPLVFIHLATVFYTLYNWNHVGPSNGRVWTCMGRGRVLKMMRKAFDISEYFGFLTNRPMLLEFRFKGFTDPRVGWLDLLSELASTTAGVDNLTVRSFRKGLRTQRLLHIAQDFMIFSGWF